MKKLLLAAAVLGLAGAALAADSGVKRTELQRSTIPGSNYVTVVARAEVGPGSATGFHTHPGDEIGVVIAGEMTLKVQGQPDRVLKPGDSFKVPAGMVHNGVGSASTGFTATTVYTVDSTKPLATPAPAP